MPYIKDTEKTDLLNNKRIPTSPGELNFIITHKILEYLTLWGINYQHINDVIGALEGAKLEFYRRIAAPYENKKIKENGDVYK